MGQHTWFGKSKETYYKIVALYRELESETDKITASQIYSQIRQEDAKNKTKYHDLFRTGKRNEDGTYTDDVITSRQECMEWIKDPKNKVSGLNLEKLKEFWNEYPDGVIHFG